MADEADIASARMEAEEELRRKAPKKPELPPRGSCYYCWEPLQHPLKFCPGGDCVEDWEFEQKMKARNGR